MLLTIDVGNSETVIGYWNGSSLLQVDRTATVSSQPVQEWIEYFKKIHSNELAKNPDFFKTIDVIIASVVPGLDDCLSSTFNQLQVSKVLSVNLDLKFSFAIDKSKFSSIGADRLANAAGASSLYGDNVIVVDFGTAITFCLLLGNEYVGGVISPGIHTSLNALVDRAAKLPKIKYMKKNSILMNNTVDSIQCGMYFGWKGLVREILNELNYVNFQKNITDVKVIATGGISIDLGFTHELFTIVDPSVTMKGLYRIYKDNQ